MNTQTNDEEGPYDSIIFHQREASTLEFDATHAVLLKHAVAEIGKVHNLFVLWSAKSEEMPGGRMEACALLVSAVEMLVSSLHLLRQRAIVEMLVLLRVALETACTALHIHFVPDARNSYVEGPEGKYLSTKSITFAKKYISQVGELWGALSRSAVHMNKTAHGPKERIENETLIQTVTLGERHTDPIAERQYLTLVKLFANIILRAAENIFLVAQADEKEFKLIAGSKVRYYCNTEMTIAKLFDEFRANAQKPNS